MNAPHLIQRQRVQLRLTDPAESWATQQRVERLLQDARLLARLDAVLTNVAGPDVWLDLDRVDVALGTLDSDRLETQLLEHLPDVLRKALADQVPLAMSHVASGRVAQAGATVFTAWLFFLEHGRLPDYWTRPAQFPDFVADVANVLANLNDGQRSLLRQTLRLAPARTRLTAIPSSRDKLLPDTLFWATAHALGFPDSENNVVNTAWPPALRSTWRELTLLALLEDRTDVINWLLETARLPHRSSAGQTGRNAILLRSNAPGPVADWLKNNAITTSQAQRNVAPGLETLRAESPSSDTALYVQNAGVVLLHPFLTLLFEKCGWIENATFRTERSRAKAVLMLHFLATGETDAPEYDLLLPKLLCGLPLDATLPNVSLSKQAQREGATLLTAAIDHWSALKDTTPDGLREAFLQREGKLDPNPHGRGWALTVETKPQDALLNRLPYGWGVSAVTLPWLPSPLRVEWTY